MVVSNVDHFPLLADRQGRLNRRRRGWGRVSASSNRPRKVPVKAEDCIAVVGGEVKICNSTVDENVCHSILATSVSPRTNS